MTMDSEFYECPPQVSEAHPELPVFYNDEEAPPAGGKMEQTRIEALLALNEVIQKILPLQISPRYLVHADRALRQHYAKYP